MYTIIPLILLFKAVVTNLVNQNLMYYAYSRQISFYFKPDTVFLYKNHL